MTSLPVIEPPGAPCFATQDAVECRDYIKDHTGTHRFNLGRTSRFLDFAHHECSLGRIFLHFVNLNCTNGFSVTKASAAPHYSFQFLLEGSCQLEGLFGNVIARPGDVFILDPDHVTREFWPQGCLQILVRIDRDVVEHMVSEELHKTLSEHVIFEPVMRDPGIVHWLRHLANMMRSDGTDPALLGNSRVVRDIERTLVTMLLTGLRHSLSDEFERHNAGIAPYYVKRAEAYIREKARDELTVDDIAAAAGVSPRSLFYGFKRWRKTTPMAYVRDVRLDWARKELEKARTDGGTVSEAAMNSGFTNFSQFSRIYKARFGESPSVTLMAN